MKEFFKNFQSKPFNYANASHAFYDIMKWLQVNRPKNNPNIIMPAYIPAKLYRYVLAAGYKPKFYDVSTELDFSIDEIRDLIDDQTQMVFAVHFFGVPVDMVPLKKLTQELDVFLMEDCAHTLNSHLNGNILGTTGDFTIFSTRKMFQYHCGGFLILNTQPWAFQPSQINKVSSLFTGYHLLGSRVKYYLNHLAHGKNGFQDISTPVVHYIDFDEEQTVNVKRMDRLLHWTYLHTNLEKLTRKRRENVSYLWNHIEDLETFSPIGLERLSEYKSERLEEHKSERLSEHKSVRLEAHKSERMETDLTEQQSNGTTNHANRQKLELIDGYVPFSLPILTPPGTRNYIQQELLSRGIDCYIGWTEAPFGMNGFPGTEKLQTQLLELPIHHFINQYQLEIMIDCLNNLEIPELLDTASIKTGKKEPIH